MASVYTNDLRLEEIGSGEQSGTWGDTTNTNLELIAEGLSFGTEAITTNADTHTSTVADGATDPARSMFIKYTGTLDSACTITIAPNTLSRVHFIENGTSGSQNIIISQGSGANVTIPPGDTKVVYLDGAGSGAAVVDAFASLNVVDLKVQDDLTVTDDMTVGGTLGVTGIATFTDDIIIGDGKTIGSASDVDAMTIAANGQVTFTQTLIGTALDISGDIDVDGTSNLDIIDVDGAANFAADVTFADGADIITASAGTSNLRIGVNAGNSIESGGNYNTVIGDEAGTALTTGDSNVLVGMVAGDALDVASDNVAVGQGALTADTKGSKSVAIGRQALTTQNFTSATDTHNTAVGYHAGTAVQTGKQNTFVGGQAAQSITTGEHNVAIGYLALGSDDLGHHSVAIGHGALYSQNYSTSTDSNNTAVGYNVGNAITTGTQNTFVGSFAGDGTDDGYGNVAMGYLALSANCGNENIAIGNGSLLVSTASANTAVGFEALEANTSGYYNTSVGYQSHNKNTEGLHSTGIGHNALYSATTGGYNTACGSLALDATTTGNNNIGVGYNALGALTEAAGCVAVGSSAGAAHLTVAGGTYIGHVAGFNSTAQNTCIGYLSAYSGNGATSLSSGGGNTLIGAYTGVAAATNTGTVIIGHNATGKGTNTGFINPTSGVYQGNNSSSWSTTSDRRIKKNITDSSIGLAELNQIQVRNFEYKTKDELAEVEADGLVETDIIEKEGIQVGSIAQEIQAILPDCVTEQDTGVLAVNPDNITWHLVKAVQELSAKNDVLEARLVKLEG